MKFSPFLVAALAAGGAQGAPIYSAVTGHYYELTTEWGTWHEMRDLAAQRSLEVGGVERRGFLACIESAEEQAAIVAMFGEMISVGDDVYGAWIGASDENNNGEWQWVTGEYESSPKTFFKDGASVGYSLWAPGEPNNFLWQNEHYVVWGWGAAGSWNDLFGTANAAAVIEYIPAPSAIAMMWLATGIAMRRRR